VVILVPRPEQEQQTASRDGRSPVPFLAIAERSFNMVQDGSDNGSAGRASVAWEASASKIRGACSWADHEGLGSAGTGEGSRLNHVSGQRRRAMKAQLR
jgi:hypothetical protein